MSTVAKGFAPGIKSVTIIRQDVLPDAGAGVQAAARQARFLASVALLLAPAPTADKTTFDVTETQTLSFELDVTMNPIQNGSTITDHSRRLPDFFECVGVFTDSPLFPPVPFSLDRANREWTKLKSFFDAREPVFIASALRIFPSMILKRLVLTRDVDTGAAIRVAISAQQIRIASSLVEIPLTQEAAAAAGANAPTNGGTQVATVG